ncbi:MAG TPA: lysophospholipid acyltransferase family protein [Actinomycetota bacterium]|nr:lysophospholipid acyltransferase family protein [Actinomycetota bacterium]
MARRGDLNGWWRFGLLVVGAACRLLFRLRVSGTANIPTSGPAIVAGNHVSALDGVVLSLVTGERRRRMTRFLVAAEFFRKAKVAWALRLYRQIPLRRGVRDAGALEEAIATIRDGALAGIFPEGTVNPDPDGGLMRGRSGMGRIALATGTPVIPVGIWGTQDRWPHSGLHWRRPWRPRVALAYGEPVEPRGDPASVEDLQVFTDLVMTAIAKQVEEARALARR